MVFIMRFIMQLLNTYGGLGGFLRDIICKIQLMVAGCVFIYVDEDHNVLYDHRYNI